ncbi:hypothetical protein ABZ570_04995 [Micromonospora sp. NPDC007271]|uniref:DMP19 family protein n=1 Tax=Micromonospora sp. NPDC007271 TaxID=3154587 RepID=UPI0033EB654D
MGPPGAVSADAPLGVARLAHVHRVFNAIMGGGFGYAVEVIELDEFERAIDAFRYLNLVEVADLLAELVRSYGESSYDERKEEAFDALINESALVLDAYRRKASENPSDFGL